MEYAGVGSAWRASITDMGLGASKSGVWLGADAVRVAGGLRGATAPTAGMRLIKAP